MKLHRKWWVWTISSVLVVIFFSLISGIGFHVRDSSDCEFDLEKGAYEVEKSVLFGNYNPGGLCIIGGTCPSLKVWNVLWTYQGIATDECTLSLKVTYDFTKNPIPDEVKDAIVVYPKQYYVLCSPPKSKPLVKSEQGGIKDFYSCPTWQPAYFSEQELVNQGYKLPDENNMRIKLEKI